MSVNGRSSHFANEGHGHRDRDPSQDQYPDNAAVPQYDASDFIIPAQDSKGISTRQWFRCQPGLDRQMEIVLRSGRFPYRTKGDICRHAVTRLMKWLETLEDVPSVTAQVDAINDIMRDELFHQEFEASFETLSKTVSGHLARQATGEARRLVAMVRKRVETMPSGFWQSRYMERLMQEHGYLLAAGGEAAVKGGVGKGAGLPTKHSHLNLQPTPARERGEGQ